MSLRRWRFAFVPIVCAAFWAVAAEAPVAQPLFEALKASDSAAVKRLLDQGVELVQKIVVDRYSNPAESAHVYLNYTPI